MIDIESLVQKSSFSKLEFIFVFRTEKVRVGGEEERCPHFRGWYVQASMELGPEDVSLLERCPHFRGWYVQASMELGPEDVSLREASSFQRMVCTVINCGRTQYL